MKQTILLVVFTALLLLARTLNAAEVRSQLIRQYPIPGAKEVPIATSIGLTASDPYAAAYDREGNYVTVMGSRSGLHSLVLRLSDDARTLIVTPKILFVYDEVVSVHARIRLASGASVSKDFQFSTMRGPIDCPELLDKLREKTWLPLADSNAIVDTLPPMQVLVDKGASRGIYYFANFGLRAPNHNVLMNLDEHGSLVRMQNKYHDLALDFKVQPNGKITYFDNVQWHFVGVDSEWHVIDTFRSANGYPTDQHELLLLPNGGYALLAVSITRLDSTQYVPGMVPNAIIGGNVIQIFDAHGNETFEWRGIDHYRVADAVHEKLADSSIDFEHANSLDLDVNGDIIMSNRHLSEITKISGETGAILWRLGGAHNQFNLRGDSVWFSYQHAARLLANGHVTLFDNAVFDSVNGVPGYLPHSRAIEFALDTATRTATAVWQWHHTPETFSVAMGNVQRLANGNTVIGWGFNYNQAITEVGRDGSTVFELSFGDKNVSYRVFKEAVPDSLLHVAAAMQPASMQTWFSMGSNSGTVHYSLDRPETVTIAVMDVLGREVTQPVTQLTSEATTAVAVPTGTLAAGSYFCTVRTGSGRFGVAPFAVQR